jgi:DNA integrity scanning protein DisA with diadenylate cyclase activity
MVNLYQSMPRFMLNSISQMLQQTKTMLNTENHQNHILDANYSPLNIEEFTNGQDHLSYLEKEMLMTLLQANSTLFE